MLYGAMMLDVDAVLQSASYGRFQIMGSNYRTCGWPTLDTFIADTFTSEQHQLRAFIGFCRGMGLVRHLSSHNWTQLALGFNGASYSDNSYDTKMAAAFARLELRGGR